MKKQVILNQITFSTDGTVNLQFLKQIVEDDGTVITSVPHRRVLSPGDDVHASIAEVVTHLKSDGWPTPSADGFDKTVIIEALAILNPDS